MKELKAGQICKFCNITITESTTTGQLQCCCMVGGVSTRLVPESELTTLQEENKRLRKIVSFAQCRLILNQDHTGVAKLERKLEALPNP